MAQSESRTLKELVNLLVATNDAEDMDDMDTWDIIDALRPYAEEKEVDRIVKRFEDEDWEFKPIYKDEQLVMVKNGAKVECYPQTNKVYTDHLIGDRKVQICRSWWVDLKHSLQANAKTGYFTGVAYSFKFVNDNGTLSDNMYMAYEPMFYALPESTIKQVKKQVKKAKK